MSILIVNLLKVVLLSISYMKTLFFLQNQEIKNKISYNRGYIALFSVIILGSVGLAVTVSLLLNGILSARLGFDLQQKNQARMSATSCAEEALQQILDNGITSGTGSLTLDTSSCNYTILSTSSQTITVQSTGFSGTMVSKINVIVSSSTPRIKLSSWQEVGDF